MPICDDNENISDDIRISFYVDIRVIKQRAIKRARCFEYKEDKIVYILYIFCKINPCIFTIYVYLALISFEFV